MSNARLPSPAARISPDKQKRVGRSPLVVGGVLLFLAAAAAPAFPQEDPFQALTESLIGELERVDEDTAAGWEAVTVDLGEAVDRYEVGLFRFSLVEEITLDLEAQIGATDSVHLGVLGLVSEHLRVSRDNLSSLETEILRFHRPFIRGDANGDARVDESDAVFTLNYLLLGGPVPECQAAADVNDDERIDLVDVTAMLQGLSFLAPPPILARDPSPGIGCAEGPEFPDGGVASATALFSPLIGLASGFDAGSGSCPGGFLYCFSNCLELRDWRFCRAMCLQHCS